jgi:lipid-A-disaccharide synthase-like uncharacterized protein
MNQTLLELSFLGQPLVITGWKLVGYTGVALFTGRWIVQLLASHFAGRSTIPRLFWYLSLSGSVLLLAYFTFGKNDSVGILSNLFPSLIAAYNLSLEFRHRRRFVAPSPHPSPPAD